MSRLSKKGNGTYFRKSKGDVGSKSRSMQSAGQKRYEELDRMADYNVETLTKISGNDKMTGYRRAMASLILKSIDGDLRATDLLMNRLLGRPLETRHISGEVDHVVGWGEVVKMLGDGGNVIDIEKEDEKIVDVEVVPETICPPAKPKHSTIEMVDDE